MSSNAETAYAALQPLVGNASGTGDWYEMTQERIDAFADATLDHQFIHIDVERAKNETPFGGTIAHGFFTLSMLVHLSTSLDMELPAMSGVVMGINYGMNKVRFINPVPSGSRIRAKATLTDVQLKGNAIDMTRTYEVEIEGQEKPALIAEWIGRTVFG